jgi:hypothetical protein
MLQFLCPFKIIFSWLYSSYNFYQGLDFGPETDFFQWEIEPARRDTEIRVMRSNMVDTMVLSWQNNM